jgi:hypothetical protein
VDDVRWEEKNNVLSERRWAGGNDVNVASWLKHVRGHPLLVLPLGGKTGTELAGDLRAEKLRAKIIRLRDAKHRRRRRCLARGGRAAGSTRRSATTMAGFRGGGRRFRHPVSGGSGDSPTHSFQDPPPTSCFASPSGCGSLVG